MVVMKMYIIVCVLVLTGGIIGHPSLMVSRSDML